MNKQILSNSKLRLVLQIITYIQIPKNYCLIDLFQKNIIVIQTFINAYVIHKIKQLIIIIFVISVKC